MHEVKIFPEVYYKSLQVTTAGEIVHQFDCLSVHAKTIYKISEPLLLIVLNIMIIFTLLENLLATSLGKGR
jgi:hypothetical protein